MAQDKARKVEKSRGARLGRLVGSTLDPRSWAHLFKIVNFFNYTHVQEIRKATVARDARISPTASFANAQNVVIGARSRIGAFASLWAGPSVGKIVLGEDVLIAPNVMLTAANYRFNDGSPVNDQAMNESDIIVGDDVWIGYGTVVLPGTKIGDGAIIGAGTIVRGVIPPRAVVGEQAGTVQGKRRGSAAEEPAPVVGDISSATTAIGASDARALVEAELPLIAEADFETEFDALSIDSFDLMALRTSLESKIGCGIPDAEWFSVERPADIVRLPALTGAATQAGGSSVQRDQEALASESSLPEPELSTRIPGTAHRRYEIGMPQMALSGLSESWLFKELGDIHWQMITEFLQCPSSAIADDEGDRLYATFTRVLLEVEPTIGSFLENGTLDLSSELTRYGAGFFFGRHQGDSKDATFRATTMSTFSKYGEAGNNTSLVKGTPTVVDYANVPSMEAMPEFGEVYRQRRANNPTEVVFECDYEILASHDINGVGLLYFATYPTIFDLCIEQAEGKGFLIGHSTVSKDLCYFANSQPNETLRFTLHEREQKDGLIEHVASLSRKGDGTRMAELRAVKRTL